MTHPPVAESFLEGFGLRSPTDGKSDALSHLYASVEEEPFPIVIQALCLDIERKVQQARSGPPTPEGCLEGKLFIPEPFCSQVLQWYHNFRISYHPGFACTLAFLLQCFWWPSAKGCPQICGHLPYLHPA